MIHCYRYHKKRLSTFSFSKFKSVSSLKKDNARLWIVVKDPTDKDISLLTDKFNLHPTTAENIVSTTSRIKYEEFDDYTFLVFKGVKSIGRDKASFYTLYFIDGNRYLITVYGDQNNTVEHLEENKKRIESLLRKGEDYIVHYIFDKEVDKYVDTRENLSEELNKMEQMMHNPGKYFLQHLFEKELLIMDVKQRADSITDVCSRLRKPTDNFIQNSLLPYFSDVYDHAIRVSEALKAYLDRIDSVRNSHLSFISNRMNETMRVLTILMALMLPLTVITGYYGMNIGLPIQHHPNAYIIISIVMLIIVILFFYLFKKMKWVRVKK